MANLSTLAAGSSITLTVTDQQSIVLNNGRSDVARLTITTGPGAGTVVTASHNGRRVYGPFGAGTVTIAAVSGDVRYELSGDTVSPLDDDGQPLTPTENQSVRALVSGAGIPITPSGDTSGVTDTAAIAAAQTAAAAAGKCVVWGAGQYYVRATNQVDAAYQAIVLQSNVSHIGQPGAKVRLVASTQPSGWGGFVFFGSGVSNIRIAGIEIDGNRSVFTSPAFASSQDGVAGSNIRLLDCIDVTVEDCYSHSAIYHGFFAVDGCRRVNARRNRITNCGYRAMHFNGTDGAGNDITDCAFDENDCWSNGQAADNPTNGGIFIALGSAYRISCRGNTVKDDPGCGIEITGTGPGVTSIAREIIVIGNRMTGCENGVRTGNNLTNAIISGNTISSSTATGIALGSMTACRVEGNIVRRGATMALTVGNNATDVLVGCSICNNTFYDNHGDATQRAALLIQAGAHIALQINNNAFIDNGATDANPCTAINMIDPASNRTKSLQIIGNLFRNNKGHGVVIYDTDDAQICDNVFMDNWESTGPRGRAIWVRGTAANTLVAGNKAVNDNVTNSLEQIVFDATVTNFRAYMNEAECSATNKFLASTGATGLAHSNVGTASWAVGVTTGSSAL
jgi:parallel beta-helix repeat protein